MDKKIYFAPMEGLTDNIFRKIYQEQFGGVDKYFTPFLSPNETKKFPTREWREIDPELNDVSLTVPQLLTNKSEHFLWAVNELAPLGYSEINLNLGCPSGTVVAKKKGSGLLYYPEELDRFLYEIFEGCPSNITLSVKTRLGKNDPEEFYEILDIYNKYPISELTIHPRIQSDYYREPIRPAYFEYALAHAKMPVIFNGELKSVADIEGCINSYPDIVAVMIGRGFITNPMLLSEEFDLAKFCRFHDALVDAYTESFSGDMPVLHRMKEYWASWSDNFDNIEKPLKALRKAKHLSDYKSAVNQIL